MMTSIMIDPMAEIYAMAYKANKSEFHEEVVPLEKLGMSEETYETLMDIIKDAIDSCPTISIDDLDAYIESLEEDA